MSNWSNVVLDSGRYRVRRALGRGGMADVVLADDLRLNRSVVLKLPRKSLLEDDPNFTERFRREIQALVRLGHPHIVRALDQGEHEGRPFVALEFLSGGSLGDRLRQSQTAVSCDPQSLRGWLAEIADALDYIHKQGYVHRDVKPDNILFDAHGNPYLTDFGIAKVVAEEEAQGHLTKLTATGFAMGTVEYMAPEFWEGTSLDGRVDQYALAVIVYEILAGCRPLEGATPLATMRLRITESPLSLAEHRHDLSPEIITAVDRALSKEANQRFAACRELSAAIVSSATWQNETVTSPIPGTKGHVLGPFGPPSGEDVNLPLSCPMCGHLLTPPSASEQSETSCPRCQRRLQFQLDQRCWQLRTDTDQTVAKVETDSTPVSSSRSFSPVGPPLPQPAPALPVAGSQEGDHPPKPKRRRNRLWIGGFLAVGLIVCLATTLALFDVNWAFDNLKNTLFEQITEEFAKQKDQSLSSTPAPKIQPPPLLKVPFDSETAVEAQDEWAEYLKQDVTHKNSVGMSMVLIPPGEFLMGSPEAEKDRDDDEYQHRVRITQPFFLGMNEVTQTDYNQVMGLSPSYFTQAKAEQDTSRFPVEDVSWFDCIEFCNTLSIREGRKPYYSVTKIERNDSSIQSANVNIAGGGGYHLPTEAEWEYACRAGTITATYYGNSFSSAQANFNGSYPYNEAPKAANLARPARVCSYSSNAFGLYDMLGNVREWCGDWYSEDYYRISPLIDPTGPDKTAFRVARGGTWQRSGQFCRSARRDRNLPSNRTYYIGFRVALSPAIPISQKESTFEQISSPDKSTNIPTMGQPEPAPLPRSPTTVPRKSQPNRATDQFAGTRAGQEWTGNNLGMVFCWCPPGSFMMGSPMDEPDRNDNEDQVNVALTEGFWLGKYEVTQSEWSKVMGTNPWQGKIYVKEGENFPATHISWKDAQNFCKRMTELDQTSRKLPSDWEYALPTEAQWEYACRAGTLSPFYSESNSSELNDYAWFDETAWDISDRYAHVVGQKRPNAFGLYDMHGNVWEWCRDWYQERLLGGNDPEVIKATPLRVKRGGSWISNSKNCRSAARKGYNPDSRNHYIGFRVVLVPVGGKDV